VAAYTQTNKKIDTGPGVARPHRPEEICHLTRAPTCTVMVRSQTAHINRLKAPKMTIAQRSSATASTTASYLLRLSRLWIKRSIVNRVAPGDVLSANAVIRSSISPSAPQPSESKKVRCRSAVFALTTRCLCGDKTPGGEGMDRPPTRHLKRAPHPLDQVNIPARTRGSQASKPGKASGSPLNKLSLDLPRSGLSPLGFSD